MRRREFIQLIAGMAAGWPVAVHAQQRPKWRVGFLNPNSPNPATAQRMAAFSDGIGQGGLREIAQIEMVARFADNQLDRLPALAQELVEQGVRVICAAAPAAVGAARGATSAIPNSCNGPENPIRSRTAGLRASPIPAATSLASSSTYPASAPKHCSCCGMRCRAFKGRRVLAPGERASAIGGGAQRGARSRIDGGGV